MAEESKMNFVINDGDSFYANETSLTFGPAQFAFDFKNISPRIDVRNQNDSKTFVIKHNVVIIEPFQIKSLAKILNDSIARFEKEYGTIETPKAIAKERKKIKALPSPAGKKKVVQDVPTYFG